MTVLNQSHIIGHRGARAEAPENTLGGFRFLRDLGINKAELDIHHSADHKLMVMHDDNKLRTTGVAGDIGKTPSTDLKKLNATADFKKPWPQIEPTPELKEVLSDWDKLEHIQIEVKPMETTEARVAMAQELKKNCDDLNLQSKHAVITSSDPDFLRESIKVNAMPHGLIAWEPEKRPLETAQSIGCKLLALDHALYSKSMAKACKKANLPVSLWTVNDAKLADKMVRRGATSIITDRPQAFVNWINQKQPANDGFMQKIKPLAWLQSKITH